MGKNKLDIINFSKIYDMFGEEAAKDTLDDVNSGRVSEKLWRNIFTQTKLKKSMHSD